MVSVRDFGAVGDGKTDDTAALQRALDAAAGSRATVLVPAGTYLCSTLTVPSHVTLQGEGNWSYRELGGTILRLNDPAARCLLDISTACGVTLAGLCLDGNERMGEGIHGVMHDTEAYNPQEDVPRIDGCKIAYFSGDGVHLHRAWCFTVRHSMLAFNGTSGIRVRGWDGFLLDNWLSGNRGPGYLADEESASITMTGNRVEWNRGGNLVMRGATHYNLTGNYIDRASGPGISLRPGRPGGIENGVFTITGNVIFRSGAPHGGKVEEQDNCQVRLEEAAGLVFSGNTLRAGQDDGGKGEFSPEYGIIYRGLRNSLIKDNVLDGGAMRELWLDQGGHEGLIVRDNPGSLLTPK